MNIMVNTSVISVNASRATVRVMCTNEELMIAHSVLHSCGAISVG
jgi:acetate kinase